MKIYNFIFVDKKLSELSDSNGERRVYANGTVKDVSFDGSQVDVTNKFRPNKENHVKLRKEKALALLNNERVNPNSYHGAIEYTNKKGKDIKLSFNEDGTFAKAETLIKKSES